MTATALREILREQPIVVVGDVMCDCYWHGVTSRISPEAPVPVVHVGRMESRPGGAANVALNLAALGARAMLFGLVGADAEAALLREQLEEQGVDCRFECVEDVPTITKYRVVSRHQQLIRIDTEESFPDAASRSLVGRAAEALADTRLLVCSDYDKGALRYVGSLIDDARRHRIRTLIDPKGADFTPYRGATIVKPNFAELEAVVGACGDEATLVERGTTLARSLDLEALLVTRGERGMTLLRDGEPPLYLAAQARDVFDVTGAGDTVIAVLGAMLAAGERIESALAAANAAAGCVVGKLGTAVATPEEIEYALGPAAERGAVPR